MGFMFTEQSFACTRITMITTHTNRAFTQINHNAAAFLAHTFHDLVEIVATFSKHIAQHIFAMQADGHIFAITNVTKDHRHMLHRLPWEFVSISMCLTSTGVYFSVTNPLDECFLTLTIGD